MDYQIGKDGQVLTLGGAAVAARRRLEVSRRQLEVLPNHRLGHRVREAKTGPTGQTGFEPEKPATSP